ncbi:restriction endonuclease subunit S [Priestia endophytica]|uniref:restriction endonuclease subunit S n=1 Tax=Priestia endophytica TaxID=135735 RepID=UPI003D2E9406
MKLPTCSLTKSPSFKEKKIGEIVNIIPRPCKLVEEENYQLVTVKRRNEGIVSRGIYKGKDIKTPTQFYIKSGDFLISKRQIVHGACEMVDQRFNDAIVSNEYTVLRGKEDILETEYFNLMSKSNYMKKQYFLSSYGVDIEKMVFNVADWKERPVFIPSVDEQKKIVSFFNLLHKKLKYQQEKIDLLEEQKKGYMQKLLTENQKNTVTYKLGDLFEERSEKGYQDYQLLAVTISKGVTDRSDMKNDSSSQDKSNYKRVLPNDIAYNSMRMWQGASGLSKYTGIVSPAYTVLKPKENVYSLYFAYLFKTDFMLYQFKKFSQGLTSDTWNLKYPLLKNIKVKVPSYQEQEQIANFFTKIDVKIQLEKNKLEVLKEQKKGFMQKMFI